MSASHSIPRNASTNSFDVAVITVCVDPETTAEIIGAVESTQWAVTSATFEAYISAVRRPYFGPQIGAAKSCIAVVDFDLDADQAVEATRYLQGLFAGKITIIALAESHDQDLLLRAMRGGCTEFLHKPFNPDSLNETLNHLYEHFITTASGAPTNTGSILTFLGAKGGVGTTTIAVHMAMYLVQVHKKRTLLIDHHPELGHACVYLGIDGSRYNYQEVVRNVSRLDSELLKGYIAKHPSGLDVLSSPDICSGLKFSDANSVATTLEFLRSEYEYVIVDCPTSMDDIGLSVIDVSTTVYLVATPEVGAIRDLARYVDHLMQIEGVTQKMQVVANRVSSRYAVDVEHIEKAIRVPVAIQLPNSYAELVRSANLGEPISLKGKSDFTSQFMKWANTVAGSTTAVEEPKPKTKSKMFAMWM
jgi:pilus assembly protein CpaE